MASRLCLCKAIVAVINISFVFHLKLPVLNLHLSLVYLKTLHLIQERIPNEKLCLNSLISLISVPFQINFSNHYLSIHFVFLVHLVIVPLITLAFFFHPMNAHKSFLFVSYLPHQSFHKSNQEKIVY